MNKISPRQTGYTEQNQTDEKSSIYPDNLYNTKLAFAKERLEGSVPLTTILSLKQFDKMNYTTACWYIFPKTSAFEVAKKARASFRHEADLGINPIKPSLRLDEGEIGFIQKMIEKTPISQSRYLLDIIIVELFQSIQNIHGPLNAYIREIKKNKLTEEAVNQYLYKEIWYFASVFRDYQKYQELNKTPLKSKPEYLKERLFFKRIEILEKYIFQYLNEKIPSAKKKTRQNLNRKKAAFTHLFNILKKMGNHPDITFSIGLALYKISGIEEPKKPSPILATQQLAKSILSYLSAIHSYAKNKGSHYKSLFEGSSLIEQIETICKSPVKSFSGKNLPKFFKDLSYLICEMQKISYSTKYKELNKNNHLILNPLYLDEKTSLKRVQKKAEQEKQLFSIKLSQKIAYTTYPLNLLALDDCMEVVKDLLSKTPINSIPLDISPAFSELKTRIFYCFLLYTTIIDLSQKEPQNLFLKTSKQKRNLEEIYTFFSKKIDDFLKTIHKSSIVHENCPNIYQQLALGISKDESYFYLPVLRQLAKGKKALSEVLKSLDLLVNELNSKIAMYEIQESDAKILIERLIGKFFPLLLLILTVQDSVECTELPTSTIENPLFFPRVCIKMLKGIIPFVPEKPEQERTFSTQTPKNPTARPKELSLNPSDSAKKIVNELLKFGLSLEKVKGSHHQLEGKSGKVTVPVHGNKRLPIGTFKAIEDRLKVINQGLPKDPA